MRERPTRATIAAVTLGTVILGLTGCGTGFRLHDASRAKLTAGVKDTYATANVVAAIEVEKKNLDSLLAEELKVVRDNQRLRVDFALLRIADDGTPMADTYTKRARQRLTELGYPDGFAQARAGAISAVGASGAVAEMQQHGELLKQITGASPPPCSVETPPPPAITLPDTLGAQLREGAENFYRLYREACTRLLENPDNVTPGSQLGQARADWQAASADAVRLDQSIAEVQAYVKEKTAAYQEADAKVKQAAGEAEATKKDLQAKAATALKALEGATDVARRVEGRDAAVKRVEALVVLLSAAAGGTADTSDPNLAKAAAVARELPSLAGDMKALVERKQAPSVNNLLIEMRHQVLLLEREKQLRTLALQRADILKARYEALRQETELWVRFGDAMCSYAVLGAKRAFPGAACDGFAVESDGATCKLAGAADIPDCLLGKPWRDAIRNAADDAPTRELYKGLAVYLRALALQGTQHEQTFRVIDVQHRETLATREWALRAWDNLVAVPIEQLDAYYQAGLKPAEIADLLIKALGLTAIAVGVSR